MVQGSDMNGEPDSGADVPMQELKGIQFVVLGLIGGLAIMTVALVAILFVGFNGESLLGDNELSTLIGYGSLALVPLALVLAFVVMPGLGTGQAGGATFAAYSGQFFVRAGMLEGPAVMMLVMFLLTACWALLGGVAVLMAALVYLFPTPEKYRAWAADRTTAA
jgi:hypothetical protein